MDDFVAMKIEGMMVCVMFKVDPDKYSIHIRKHSNKKVLYVKIVKALYSCIKSGMLWYNLFFEILHKVICVLNPYDPFIAIKVINGKQCTLTW